MNSHGFVRSGNRPRISHSQTQSHEAKKSEVTKNRTQAGRVAENSATHYAKIPVDD